MKIKILTVVVSSAVYLGVACKSDNSKDISPEQLFSVPANFPNPVYNFSKNRVTQNGFELGRELF